MAIGKYTLAQEAIKTAVERGQDNNVAADDVLLATIVQAVADYSKAAGRDAAREALLYELQQLGGDVDTVFLRSR